MIKEFKNTDIRTFSLPSVLYKEENVLICRLKKVSKDEVKDARFIYESLNYENGKPLHIVREMAELGYFDGYLSHNAIKHAKKKGVLPDGYTIHHIVPLKLGGSNSVDNLCIVEGETHALLHKLIFQPILDSMKDKEEAVLILPAIPRVIKKEDRTKFFLYSELRKLEENAVCVARHKKNNINADMGFRDAFCRSGRGARG